MVRRALGLAAALGALALTRCFPPPLDESGLRCSTTRPCGDGYVCFDGVCNRPDEVDAGPDNWLPNPGFEVELADGGPEGWAVRTGRFAWDTQTPHSGLRAVRMYSVLDAGQAPSVQTLVDPVHDRPAGETWCAQAWVRADTPNDAGVLVGLYLRERDDAGTVISQSVPSRPLVGSGWVKLEESFITLGASRLDARVGFIQLAQLGQSVVVDDVALKRSATTSCTWP